MNAIILDVREQEEFEAEHIESSIHLPLSRFASAAPAILNEHQGRDLVIMCRSGGRARLAEAQIKQLGFAGKLNATVFEGGILEWKRQGRPVVSTRKAPLPIMRQVQLVVGPLILATVALGTLVNPWFLAATAFMGAGLTVAGATGFCGMAVLLSKMPWNTRRY